MMAYATPTALEMAVKAAAKAAAAGAKAAVKPAAAAIQAAAGGDNRLTLGEPSRVSTSIDSCAAYSAGRTRLLC